MAVIDPHAYHIDASVAPDAYPTLTATVTTTATATATDSITASTTATATVTDSITTTATSDSTRLSPLLPTSDAELVASGWPWKGGITFSGVRMRYREDFDPVLRGVTFQIHPGASVGIVGRTGSGKSSLLRALLRLTELESGTVAVDGVDVSCVGLDALRSGVSIIPQDPVLFSGTIRLNLDPFHLHSDQTLWTALVKSNLAPTIQSLPGGLSYMVTEGGDNFSSGQRQLLCLARALVRRSRILLLDEATSSVDFETDAIIQRTIREEFGQGRSTVLTIAHRLDTVMDADKIMVMEAGQVSEYGSPKELLRNPKSLFSQLVAAEQQSHSKNENALSSVKSEEGGAMSDGGVKSSRDTSGGSSSGSGGSSKISSTATTAVI